MEFVQPLRRRRLDIPGQHYEIGKVAGFQPALAILGKLRIGALDRIGGNRLVQGEALVGIAFSPRFAQYCRLDAKDGIDRRRRGPCRA